jgi:major membrane immunogen (membrane-anchored lipoprotein)
MKKLSLILVLVLVVCAVTACTGEIKIVDGTYRAEYSDFDQQGYKEFIEITFEDGLVTKIVADAVSGIDGSLKSESEEIKAAMEPVVGTFPAKYYQDLINQYIQNPTADSIDIVAGATSSSNSFISLMKALEKAVRAGNTEPVVIDR